MHKGRAPAVDDQDFLGLGEQWTFWSFFWSIKSDTKVKALCKGGLSPFTQGFHLWTIRIMTRTLTGRDQ